MGKRVPAFVAQLAKGDVNLVLPHMTNWMRVYEFMRKLHPTRSSISVLATMLAAEYQRKGGPRMDIVVRIHGRLQHIRHEVERVELGA